MHAASTGNGNGIIPHSLCRNRAPEMDLERGESDRIDISDSDDDFMDYKRFVAIVSMCKIMHSFNCYSGGPNQHNIIKPLDITLMNRKLNK